MDINVVKLENEEEYLIIDTIILQDKKYLILVNEKNYYDICIRKVIEKDDKEVLVKLESEEEFENVVTRFNNKHVKEEIEKNEE